jgi:hypothetical protein
MRVSQELKASRTMRVSQELKASRTKSLSNLPFVFPQARHQRPVIIVNAPHQHTRLRGGDHIVLMRDMRVPPQAIHRGLALVMENARALVRVLQVLF